MRIVALCLILAGCGVDHSQLNTIRVGETSTQLQERLGAPKLKQKIAQGSLWLWCENGFSKSHITIAHMLDGYVLRAHHKTLTHLDDCEFFLRELACKVSDAYGSACVWLDKERF